MNRAQLLGARSLLKPTIGVNISDMFRDLAVRMEAAKAKAERAELDKGHDYATTEEWLCVGFRRDGACRLETVQPVRGVGRTLFGEGPNMQGAEANMRYVLVRALVARKRATEAEAKERAANVDVRIVDVIDQRSGAGHAG